MIPSEEFENALAKRLSKLAAMPVDTSRLERAVRSQIGIAPKGYSFSRVMRSFSAVAAGLIFLAIVGFALLQNRPVQASADLMLQMHRNMVAGTIPSMKVDSVEEVNSAFAAFGQTGVTLAAPPETQVMACCMQKVGSRKVACILLKDGTIPVTLSVADKDALNPLATTPVSHHGESFHVQSDGTLNMVTVDRGTHRICLIGEMPAEKLMSLADNLKF